jgi:hypothetical protein
MELKVPVRQTRFWPGRQYTNLFPWLQASGTFGSGSV